jgi:hypothetical protein
VTRVSLAEASPQASDFLPPTLGECARLYADLGARVFPIRPGTKAPALKGWQRCATRNPAAIATWWNRWPAAGIGWPMGPHAGVFDLDVDRDQGEASLVALETTYGTLPTDTPCQITGSGDGRQILFSWPHGRTIKNSESKLAPKIDVRGDGGYIVLPPSPHPSGGCYRWVPGCEPWEIPFAPAPQWLLDLLDPPKGQTAATVTPLRAVREGVRNRTLFSLCLRQARVCDTKDDLLDVALTINADFIPPLPEQEVRWTVDSAWSYQITGRNQVGRGSYVHTSKNDLRAFMAKPNWLDAMALDLMLRLEHGARSEPFAVVPPAIAQANLLPGLGWRRIWAARSACVAMGRLILVHKGGGPGNPNLYRLARTNQP